MGKIKPKAKCCRSTPRCRRCPVVVLRAERERAEERTPEKAQEKALKKAQKKAREKAGKKAAKRTG